MNKAETLNDPGSCLNKARPFEPIFVLRAKDPTAAQTIRLWAAQNEGVQSGLVIEEALAVADSFDMYRNSIESCTQSPPPVGTIGSGTGKCLKSVR